MNGNEAPSVETLMHSSGVKFGTSGARGLVSAMTDFVCAAYTTAFLRHAVDSGQLSPSAPVLVGGDRRDSSPRIMTAALWAARQAGHPVRCAGLLPSPALALAGLSRRAATVMVTGSHIPADRNGMKFTLPSGEITKEDELGILRQRVASSSDFDAQGALTGEARGSVEGELADVDAGPTTAYLERFRDAFAEGCLQGLRIGLYGHSAVGRELLAELYSGFGAEVIELGFSDSFVPVDTEAIRHQDVELAAQWSQKHRLHAIVSTDGDSDRPLIADEHGRWLRGDVAGILVAEFFEAEGVATPVSCNGAVDLCGRFVVERTKIGSPYVIEGMKKLSRSCGRVVGYEANGGFLQHSELAVPGAGILPPLPTRDAAVVHLAILSAARTRGGGISQLVATLPRRFTASARDQSFAPDRSQRLLLRLRSSSPSDRAALLGLGGVEALDETDGLRFTLTSGEVVHLRASGNAPELRCYSEADSPERAEELVEAGLTAARRIES